MTKGFKGTDGLVTQANCVKVDWKKKNNKLNMVEVAGTEFSLNVNLVILAMGFCGVGSGRLIKDLNVLLTDMNTVGIDENYMTSEPGVFAAGDAVMGPSLVVKAIYQGREAAKGIHNYVMQHSLKNSMKSLANY
jgi:glutamate synthase (NADPH/NADH) small chain